METKKKCCCKKKVAEIKPTDELPGVAINKADDNAVNKELVKERTSTLNNNPRNND